MSGPWEKYQNAVPSLQPGPWTKYQISTSTNNDVGQIPESTPPIKNGEGLIPRSVRAIKETVMAPVAPWMVLSKDRKLQEMGERAASPRMGKFGLSQVAQEIGDAGRRGGFAASKRTGEMIAESPIAGFSPAVAAGLGSVASTIGDIAAGGAILSPQDAQIAVGTEAVGLGAQMGAEAFKPAAVSMGRRALGFTKQHLTSTKSVTESLRRQAMANRAAADMLDKKVIGAFGDPVNMQVRASKLLANSGKELDNVLTALDDSGVRIDTNEFAVKLIDDIKPRFSDEQKVIESIIEDLQTAKGGLTLSEAKSIFKKRWGELGYDKTVGTTASNIYRKASKVLEETIGDAVKKSGGKEMATAYALANKTFANASTALKGILNKSAMEMGNNLIDLPSHIIGAGQLASGNVPGALATTGILQAIRRRGAAPIARLLNSVSSGVRPTMRTAAGVIPRSAMSQILEAAGRETR